MTPVTLLISIFLPGKGALSGLVGPSPTLPQHPSPASLGSSKVVRENGGDLEPGCVWGV